MPTIVDPSSATEVPSKLTIEAMEQKVQLYCKGPEHAEAGTIARDGIREAILMMNTDVWEFSLTDFDVTMANPIAGTQGRKYSIPANFKAHHSGEIVDSSGQIVGHVSHLSPKRFQAVFPWRDSGGLPSHYTNWNLADRAEIEFDAPGSNLGYPTIRLHYYREIRYPAPGAPLDAPVIAELFVLWSARAYLAAHIGSDRQVDYAEKKSGLFWGMLLGSDRADANRGNA